MKFGKRRWEAKHEANTAGITSSPPPGPDPGSPSVVGYEPSAGEPDDAEAIVNAEAVELPAAETPPAYVPPAPPPAAHVPPPPPLAAHVPPAPPPAAHVPPPPPLAAHVPPAPPPAAHVPPPPPLAAHVPPAPPPAAPFPVAEEPVAVVSSGPDPGGVTPLGEAGPFYASGHAHGTAPSWPEPVLALAAERPEVVVGAAFAGGILLAAILRRLGN